MNEIQFVKKYKHRWEALDKELSSGKTMDADELSEHYIQLNDDLAYAQTYFPNSPTSKFLNQLTLKVHRKIYVNKRVSYYRFWTFFTEEVPKVAWENRKELYAGFFTLLFFVSIGIFSAAQDSELVKLILGDSYVRLTEANIEKGDPLGIYGHSAQTEMFIRISANNIKVSFYAYLLGILANVGTLVILMHNGIMLGAFLHFFYAKGLFSLAFSTVFLHGAMEISAIALAGAAGFILGNSLLFPGTYTRLQSLQKGVKQSLKLIFSLVPVFLMASLIESYFTRHYLLFSSGLRWSIVICTFMIIVVYYFIWPYFKFRKKTEQAELQLQNQVHSK